MDRDQLIQCLIQDQLEKLDGRQYSRQLMQVVERGFRGFSRMSDAELSAELSRRGLRAEFDDRPDPVDELDDADADDEEDDSDIRSFLCDIRDHDDDWAPSLN